MIRHPDARATPPSFFRAAGFYGPLASGLGGSGALAVWGTQVEAVWPEFHEVPLPIRGLPAGFEGCGSRT